MGAYNSVEKTFHTGFFKARGQKLMTMNTRILGIVGSTVIFVWFFGIYEYFKVTFRTVVPERLYKYFPTEHGGNLLYPFQVFFNRGYLYYPVTQWNSFDQRSFFPHTDKFKMKIAICHEDLTLIEKILARNFEILNSVIEDKKKLTPLALASMLGKTEFVEYFISKGADIEAKDFEGNTPLMLAVIYNNPQVVKRLIKSGANLEEKDRYGFTVIEKAQNRGRKTIAEFLENIEQQPKINEVNPVTYKLENYEYVSKGTGSEIVKRYQIEKYYKPQIYPYFKITQGLLVYFFGGYDLENLEILISPANIFLEQDDAKSSDQQLGGFGEILKDWMGVNQD